MLVPNLNEFRQQTPEICKFKNIDVCSMQCWWAAMTHTWQWRWIHVLKFVQLGPLLIKIDQIWHKHCKWLEIICVKYQCHVTRILRRGFNVSVKYTCVIAAQHYIEQTSIFFNLHISGVCWGKSFKFGTNIVKWLQIVSKDRVNKSNPFPFGLSFA